MRQALLAAVIAAFFSIIDTPASAAIVTTEATSCAGTACGGIPAHLQPFDTSLGVLENIIVQADVVSMRAYFSFFDTFAPDPLNTTGSAHLEYRGPYQFNLNNVVYTVNISGQGDLALTVGGNGTEHLFSATGSSTFNIDHDLLASFLSPTANCQTFICSIGLDDAPHVADFVQSSNNLKFVDFEFATETKIKLTYVFRPVPEPATWAMMLLGLGVIGGAMRRRQNPRSLERYFGTADLQPVEQLPLTSQDAYVR